MTVVHNECLYQWGRFSFRLADQTSQAMLGTSPLPISSEPLLLVSSYIDCFTRWFSFHLFVLIHGFLFYPAEWLFHYIHTKTIEALYLPSQCTMMTSWNGNISMLLAVCAGNSPVIDEFPLQRPVARSFDVFFDLRSLVNNRDAGDLRHHRAHYDITVI